MKKSLLLALLSIVSSLPSEPPPVERARINNRKPAGVLKNGVLTLQLEVRAAKWYPETDDGPRVDVQAFAEVGQQAQIRGPLIRVPAGARVELSMRNAVPNTNLAVHGLSRDSIRLASDHTQRLNFRLDTPGTY